MRALKVRSMIRQDFEVIFNPSGKYHLDALLTPTTPTTAFKMDAVYGDSVLMQYADQLTVPANHAGVPGISIPAGLDAQGLPIGIQLLGPDFSESALLNIAYAFESATQMEPWRQSRPVVLRGVPES
jgi:aspartyl-tRNA(Asn)/glutamyl-tRNA(Gln) amidotransferase subunit A